jgi:hypothetical protein
VAVFSSGRDKEARLADGEPEGDEGDPEAKDRRFVGPTTGGAIGDSQNQSPNPGEPSRVADSEEASGVPVIEGLRGGYGESMSIESEKLDLGDKPIGSVWI